MNITAITALLAKLSEFGGLEVEIFIEVWFWLYGATFMANGTYYERPNVKRDGTKGNSNFKRQTAGK